MLYRIEISKEDADTIDFVGDRYAWSEALRTIMGKHFQEGVIALAEHEAWDLNEKFQSDTEGGHSYFPMLRHDSDLASRLFTFMMSIV